MDTDYTLVADTRESAVIPYLSEFNVNFITRQITIGDYAIMKGTKILGCFERKTFDDFAASFKDGRYYNIEKMRSLRSQTGCDLYVILEGNQFPAENTKFQGVSYSAILAAITNLMVRDKIQIIYSKNQQYTANRLSDIVNSYKKLHIDKPTDLDYLLEKITELQQITSELIAAKLTSGGSSDDTETVAETCDTSQLTQKIHVSDATISNNMWATLPQISQVTAKIISTKFTLQELANGNTTKVEEIKTAQGRKISPAARASLLSVSLGDVDVIRKMLSAIPSISAQTVNLLLNHYEGDIRKILNAEILELSEIKIQQATRTIRFGAAKAEKIYKMARYLAPS